ncbi:sperm-associated microtubule inner protein 5 isoform X2 [Macrotis lagotis]
MGISFNKDTMNSVNEFNNVTRRNKDQLEALRYRAASADKLHEICSKETVLRMIHDYYLCHHPYQIEADHKRKPSEEPYIPGWAGHMPRVRVTELGCAVRYHVMSKRGYEDFVKITETHKRGPLKKYEKLVEDKPFKNLDVSSEFCQNFKPKCLYDDTTGRTPGRGNTGASLLYNYPTVYRGPCKPGKYLEPLSYTSSAEG